MRHFMRAQRWSYIAEGFVVSDHQTSIYDVNGDARSGWDCGKVLKAGHISSLRFHAALLTQGQQSRHQPDKFSHTKS